MILPEHFQFRPAQLDDINHGILNLIQEFRDFQLDTNYQDQWKSYFDSLDLRHQHWVIFEINTQTIVASGTIWIEPKIIHNFGKVGHIEDIIVSSIYRKHGLGKYLVEKLIKIINKAGAYKAQLHSDQNTITFYEKNGFNKCDPGLSIYFSEK